MRKNMHNKEVKLLIHSGGMEVYVVTSMIHFIHSLILEISAKDMEIRGSDPLG
jgi:hypothetical protein